MVKGLLKKGMIAIAGVLMLIALVWFFVVDWALKIVIESQGTKAVGAKVDVQKVDLSLMPAGIEMTGLQVTNPDNPMTNAMDVKRIYSDIELMPLIQKKVIIDNLRMEGIRVNTPRKSSGAIPGLTTGKKDSVSAMPPWLRGVCDSNETVQLTIPKVADILSREPLQSLQQVHNFRTKIDNTKINWQKRLNDLPGPKALDAYRARINKLKSNRKNLANLMGSATEIKTLHHDLQNDLNRLKKAKQAYEKDFENLQKESTQLMKAPMEEVRRLKAKYAISAEGAANMSRLLFGPSVCQWWQKGYAWYERIKPYIGSLSTQKTEQKNEPKKPEPKLHKGDLPTLLIRQLHIDAQLDAGTFTGEAADITSHPEIWTQPLTFKLIGRQMKQLQKIDINGILNSMQIGHPKHDVKLLVKKLALQNVDLSPNSTLPLSIAQALADVNMDLNLSGSKLNALAKTQLDNVQMLIADTADSELSKALTEAVASVTRFSLTAIVKGSDPDYQTKIESDLDQTLRKAVSRIITKATAQLENQLRSAITEQTKGPLNDIQKQLGDLNNIAGELTQRLNLGNALFKETKLKLPF